MYLSCTQIYDKKEKKKFTHISTNFACTVLPENYNQNMEKKTFYTLYSFKGGEREKEKKKYQQNKKPKKNPDIQKKATHPKLSLSFFHTMQKKMGIFFFLFFLPPPPPKFVTSLSVSPSFLIFSGDFFFSFFKIRLLAQQRPPRSCKPRRSGCCIRPSWSHADDASLRS